MGTSQAAGRWWARASLGLAIGLCVPHGAHAQVGYYSGANNPTPTTGNKSIFVGEMSASGNVVVGWRARDINGVAYRQPVAFFPYTGGVDLSSMQIPSTSVNGEPLAISRNGQQAGGWINSASDMLPALWSQLQYAPPTVGAAWPGAERTVIQGLNQDGSVAVGYVRFPDQSQLAFRRVGGTLENLGGLPGASSSTGRKCSADGSIIVGSSLVGSVRHAVRWTVGDGGVVCTSLGILPGGDYSSASALTPDGAVIIGGSRNGQSNANGSLVRPFRYTDATGMVELPLPAGMVSGEVFDLSDDASAIVGQARDAAGALHAMYWSPATGAILFKDLLIALGDLPASSTRTFVFANGISANGRHIAAAGYDENNIESFVCARNVHIAPAYMDGMTEVLRACQDSASRIELRPKFRGFGPLTYSWTFNGQPVVPDANVTIVGSTLTIANASMWPSGSFVCTASGPYGSASSPPAVVTNYAPVVFDTTPQSQTICDPGAGVSFTAVASGTPFAGNVRWQLEQIYAGGSNWEDIETGYPLTLPCGEPVQAQIQPQPEGGSTLTLRFARCESQQVRVRAVVASGCYVGVPSVPATLTISGPGYSQPQWTSPLPVLTRATPVGGTATFTAQVWANSGPVVWGWQARRGPRTPWVTINAGVNTIGAHTFSAAGTSTGTLLLTDISGTSVGIDRTLDVRAAATGACGQAPSSLHYRWLVQGSAAPWSITNLHPTALDLALNAWAPSSRVTGLSDTQQFVQYNDYNADFGYEQLHALAMNGAPGSFIDLTTPPDEGFFGRTILHDGDGGVQIGRDDAGAVAWSGTAASRRSFPPVPAGLPNAGHIAFPTVTSGQTHGGSTGDPSSGRSLYGSRAALWQEPALTYVDLQPGVAYPSGGIDSSIVNNLDSSQQVGSFGTYWTFDGPPSWRGPYACMWSGTAQSFVSLVIGTPQEGVYSEALAVTSGVQGGWRSAYYGLRRASMWFGTAESALDVAPRDLDHYDNQILDAHGDYMVGCSGWYEPNDLRALLWHVPTGAYENLHAALPAQYAWSRATEVRVTACEVIVGGSAYNTLTSREEAMLWRRPVNTGNPTVIATQPLDTLADAGQTATLSVLPQSPSSHTFQWRSRTSPTAEPVNIVDGPRVTGSQGPVLQITSLTLSDGGWYDCVVTPVPGCTAATSRLALLAVEGLPQCGRSDIAGPNQSIGPDRELSADDIVVFLSWYFSGDLRADVAGLNQSTTLDGAFTADDIIVFLSRYFAGC